MTDALAVWFEDRLIAHVTKERRNVVALRYEPDFVADPTATPLSRSLPVTEGTYAGNGLVAYLWGLLPEDEATIVGLAREAECRRSDIVGLLGHVGNDVAGAAQYTPLGERPEASTTGTVEWIDEADIEQRLVELDRSASAWRRRGERWSLAGAQRKMALYRDSSGRWGVPSGATPTTHILKPSIPGLPDHDLNEHICLSAANNLGLRAADSTIMTFGGQNALVVKRYDRLVASDGSVRRVHQEDMCQAHGVHPESKYESDGGPSIQQIGDMIRLASTGADEDLDRFRDALITNWLTRGPDAHGKNYGLLLRGPGARLAPLYDMASDAPYPRDVQQRKLAHKIGGENRPDRIRERHWRRAADQLRLDSDETIARVRDLGRQLPEAVGAAVAAVESASPEFSAAAHAIADSIIDHSASVLRDMAD